MLLIEALARGLGSLDDPFGGKMYSLALIDDEPQLRARMAGEGLDMLSVGDVDDGQSRCPLSKLTTSLIPTAMTSLHISQLPRRRSCGPVPCAPGVRDVPAVNDRLTFYALYPDHQRPNSTNLPNLCLSLFDPFSHIQSNHIEINLGPPFHTIQTPTMFSQSLRAPLRATSRSIPRLANATRTFTSSRIARGVQEIARDPVDTPLSLWNFTEEENMVRETVRRFAEDVIGPKAREMDEAEVMDPVSKIAWGVWGCLD